MKWYREHRRATILGVILLLLLSLTVASYVNQGTNSWLGMQLERISAFLQEPVRDGENLISTTVKAIFQFKRCLRKTRRSYKKMKNCVRSSSGNLFHGLTLPS